MNASLVWVYVLVLWFGVVVRTTTLTDQGCKVWFAVCYFTGFKGLGRVPRQYTHPFAAFYTYFRTHFTSHPYAHTHVRRLPVSGPVRCFLSLAGICRNETVELTRTKGYENV